jgi:hypothetical protein
VSALLLLWACSEGDYEPSQIEQLQIVDVVVNPLEVSPGQELRLQPFVADPQRRPREVLLWTCTFDGQSCAESLLQNPRTWLHVLELEEDTGEEIFTLPSEIASWMGDEDVLRVQLFALACVQGLCPAIEQARIAVAEEVIDDELRAALLDPPSMLRNMPWEGVSLATREFWISERPESERMQNPVFEPSFIAAADPYLEIERGSSALLSFVVTEVGVPDIVARGYTTIGRFHTWEIDYDEDTNIHFQLDAPRETGGGRYYVVLRNSQGGSAVWRQELYIR